MPTAKYCRSVLLALAPLVMLVGCSEKVDENVVVAPTPHPVKILTLGTLDEQNIRIFPGVVISRDQTTLSFRVPGQMQSLDVLSGQQVSQGDILASIDPVDLQLTLARGSAALNLAEVTYERNERLAKEQLIAETELDKARSVKESAEVQVNQLKADIDYATLRAPFDGTISRTYVENFEFVGEKQPIMNIQSSEMVEVQFQATENIISQLSTGTIASIRPLVRFSQFEEEAYESTISEVDTQADPNTLSYKITLLLPKPQGIQIFSGMSADVIIDPSTLFSELSTSYFVPLTALSNKSPKVGDKAEIWLFDNADGSVHKQEATINLVQRSRVLISSNLKNGDTIVISGISELSEGLIVTEWKRERGL